jgi:hypothetical protein
MHQHRDGCHNRPQANGPGADPHPRMHAFPIAFVSKLSRRLYKLGHIRSVCARATHNPFFCGIISHKRACHTVSEPVQI